MSIIKKTMLRCDRCGKVVEAPESVASLGLPPFPEGGLAGWIQTDGDHHLCADCARPYLAKKSEMERELKHLAGIETIEIDL